MLSRSIEYRNVTDRQTDGYRQNCYINIVRQCAARAIKIRHQNAPYYTFSTNKLKNFQGSGTAPPRPLSKRGGEHPLSHPVGAYVA